MARIFTHPLTQLIMEIKPRKNKYDHIEVECPFCGKSCYFRAVTRTSPDQLRELKRHISNQAKAEALAYFIADNAEAGKHLEYYKAHTAPKKILVKTENREYDEDLKLAA